MAISAKRILSLVASSAGQAQEIAQSPSLRSSLGPVHHKRLCDQPMTWQYKDPPHDVPDKYKDLMGLWTGEVYFNNLNGKYHAARLKVKAELPNYQGEGTKFEFESSYAEDIVDKP